MNNLREYGYTRVAIEVTNRCNMRCSFCPWPLMKRPLRHMATEDIFNILDELSQVDGLYYVHLNGYGEPLLHPDIWRINDKCRELGLKGVPATNGWLFTEQCIENLIDHPPQLLRVSLQVLDPAYFTATRGLPAHKYETYIHRVARTLARLLDIEHGIEEVRTDLAVNDDRDYGLWTTARVSLLRRLGLIPMAGDPTIFNQSPRNLKPHLTRFLKMVEGESRSFTFSQNHLDECIENYYNNKYASWYPAYVFKEGNFVAYKNFFNGRRVVNNYPVKRGQCLHQVVSILADGTVVLCCYDYQGLTALGNVKEAGLMAVLEQNKSLIQGLRQEGDLPFDICRRCLGAPSWLGAALRNRGWL
ncbi:MAG: radical SAM protein [Deltaproteobacteria bacterium]|nr:radical SAM protein [Deltaproteobacteria bacterium]